MVILQVLMIAFASMLFLQQTKSEIHVPSKQYKYFPSSGLNITCLAQNESYCGWYNLKNLFMIMVDPVRPWVPVVQSRSDVKNKPAVVKKTVGSLKKTCTLIFPKGLTSRLAGGKYTCTGNTNEESVEVYTELNVDSFPTRQSKTFMAGNLAEFIFLDAFSYPPATFKWKKDKVPIDFGQDRISLHDDGSLIIRNVKKSDAGVYSVKIIWENRVVRRVRIKVTVLDSRVAIVSSDRNPTYSPSSGMHLSCLVRNESFVGWFKGNIKFPVVDKIRIMKDKPVVIKIANWYNLEFPRGLSPSSAGGKYVCKGKTSEDEVFVHAKYPLIQIKESFRLGTNGKITPGVFTQASFKWRKDKVPIDFSQSRFTLKDDGSIGIRNVTRSDAGVYDVKIMRKNGNAQRVRIKVKVISVTKVYIATSQITLHPSHKVSVTCYIRNEQFVGWFKADSNTRIPVVPNIDDVTDQPAVVMVTFNKRTKIALLIFPRGSSASNAGKYVCKGEIHHAVLAVNAK